MQRLNRLISDLFSILQKIYKLIQSILNQIILNCFWVL